MKLPKIKIPDIFASKPNSEGDHSSKQLSRRGFILGGAATTAAAIGSIRLLSSSPELDNPSLKRIRDIIETHGEYSALKVLLADIKESTSEEKLGVSFDSLNYLKESLKKVLKENSLDNVRDESETTKESSKEKSKVDLSNIEIFVTKLGEKKTDEARAGLTQSFTDLKEVIDLGSNTKSLEFIFKSLEGANVNEKAIAAKLIPELVDESKLNQSVQDELKKNKQTAFDDFSN